MTFTLDCNMNTLLLIIVIALVLITIFNVRCYMNNTEKFDENNDAPQVSHV